jgi:hypothetical protein
VCISSKALKNKALAMTHGRYQQSYPQKHGMSLKVVLYQALRAYFLSSLEQNRASGTF